MRKVHLKKNDEEEKDMMTADSPEPVLSSVSFFFAYMIFFCFDMAERTVPNSIRSLVGRNVSLWIGSVVETRRRKYVCGP